MQVILSIIRIGNQFDPKVFSEYIPHTHTPKWPNCKTREIGPIGLGYNRKRACFVPPNLHSPPPSNRSAPAGRPTPVAKLAASVMNAHYHPYADISSPHPPSPDNNNSYSPALGGGGGGGGVGHRGHHQSHHQQHHNGHNNGPAQMNTIEGHQQGFHHSNNNVPSKHCVGCSSKMNLKAIFNLYKYIHKSKVYIIL